MRDTSARARERAVTENLPFFSPTLLCHTGNQQTLSFGFARTQNSGDGFSPRARASSDAPTGARDSPARRVRFRARARTFFAPFARERERKGTPREREKERASSRATSPKSVGNNTRRMLLFLVCGRKKRRKKSQRWTEGGLYYDAKRKRALLSMAIKISPFFFVSKELDCEKGWLCCCW